MSSIAITRYGAGLHVAATHHKCRKPDFKDFYVLAVSAKRFSRAQ